MYQADYPSIRTYNDESKDGLRFLRKNAFLIHTPNIIINCDKMRSKNNQLSYLISSNNANRTSSSTTSSNSSSSSSSSNTPRPRNIILDDWKNGIDFNDLPNLGGRHYSLLGMNLQYQAPIIPLEQEQTRPHFEMNPLTGDLEMKYNLTIGSLTQLANNFYNIFIGGNAGTNNFEDVKTPLNEEKIKTLEVCKFSSITTQKIGRPDIDKLCTICQSNFNDDDQITILPCGGKHYYHKECITEWLSKFSKKCPICRDDIDVKLSINDLD